MVVFPDPGAPEMPTRYRWVGSRLAIRIEDEDGTLYTLRLNALRGHSLRRPYRIAMLVICGFKISLFSTDSKPGAIVGYENWEIHPVYIGRGI